MAVLSILFLMAMTQCSSDSGGEDPTDDTIQGNNDDDPGNGNTDDGTTGGTNDEVTLTSFINPSDPQLLSAEYEDGNQVILSGAKDDQGMVTEFDQIQVLSPSGEVTTFYLDGEQRIDEIILPDGALYDFDWITDTRATLAILSKDRQVQVNFEYDAQSTENKSPVSFDQKRSKNRVADIQRSLGRSYGNSSSDRMVSSRMDQSVLLSITQCGELSDPPFPPYAEIIDGQGNLLRTLKGNKVAKGQYEFIAPVPEPASTSGMAVCTELANKVEEYCKKLELVNFGSGVASIFGVDASQELCNKASQALDQLPPSIDESIKQALKDNCKKLIEETLPLTCLLYVQDPESTFADRVCASETKDFDIPDNSVIYGVVPVAPIDKTSQSEVITGATSIPDLFLDLGDETLISDLVLNPSSPQAGQGYQAVLTVGCAAPGMVVTIQVSGTDGFSDTVTYNETASLPSADYTISVPGANQGVQDTITVTVSLPDGSVLTRAASLVFG